MTFFFPKPIPWDSDEAVYRLARPSRGMGLGVGDSDALEESEELTDLSGRPAHGWSPPVIAHSQRESRALKF